MRERDDERVSARPREGERETEHAPHLFHYSSYSLFSRTHTHIKPARAPPHRGNFSHACKQEQRTPKTEDHIANKNTYY